MTFAFDFLTYISKFQGVCKAVWDCFFFLMAKGFWVVTTTVTNPAFAEYVEAFQPWVESIGGAVLAKDMESKTVEGQGGKLAVIIEFPSKKAAIDAYNSAEYQ